MSHSDTPPVIKRAPLTRRHSSLKCISAAEHHFAESAPKRAGQNTESISQEAIHQEILAKTNLHNYYLLYLLLIIFSILNYIKEYYTYLHNTHTFRKPNEDAFILESNVTPNISRSSDSCSPVLPIVNGGDWECITHDLETILMLWKSVCNWQQRKTVDPSE